MAQRALKGNAEEFHFQEGDMRLSMNLLSSETNRAGGNYIINHLKSLEIVLMAYDK